jgi:alpha-D-xyloside xylohydrolase
MQSRKVLKNICRAKAGFRRARLSAARYDEGHNSTARLKPLPSRRTARRPFLIVISCALTLWAIQAAAQSPVVLNHNGSTISLEPYAPNIIRVTLSLQKDQALAAPGFGFIGHADAGSWTHQHTDAADIYQSSRMIVGVDASHPGGTPPRTIRDISKYFNGSTPGAHITITTPAGKKLLEMTGWSMSVPNYKDGNAGILHDKRSSDQDFYQIGANFVSPNDEHYYGLGQNQEGFLDYRGHRVECWHNYTATGGPSICVPFVVTNHGYGLVWDNPSKTTIEPGFNERTNWTSEVGNRVSYFVIAGENVDEIYSGYRLLTGATPMLPKAAYGFVQCKQRYLTQEEMLNVAKGYRERHLPLDVLVLDWFYYTKMGEFDFAPDRFPDPAAMNKQLHDMGIQTMISVWPRFTKDSRFYDTVLKHRWFEHLADGTPTNGLPYDRAGSDIDTSNPEAARWYWNLIRDNILSKGFDSLWADETEPDLPPNGSYFSVGPGTRFYNIYPLVHTAALYNGFRRDVSHRALILSRDAYLGSQRNGTMVWSSDISPTWDAFKRQIPTGLDFTASGMAYWTNDVGGWQYLPAEHHPASPPLLDPSDARDNVGGYDDYPELYTRWFEYGAFLPVMRTHGSRDHNEVWSYGKQAEPILEKYLRLRYQLMPYIYSLGFKTYQTGAPFMRALFMDFPNDGLVADVKDEYMFGSAFLVAPITDQGTTFKNAYLPAGSDWYNYWTNERYHGGQIAKVDAPVDTIPLFVRAGSIVPLGSVIESTNETQKIEKIRIYPGADADFTLYDDDGKTYAYEKGNSRITHLHWDDAAKKLTHDGAKAWSGPDSDIVEVVH